MLFEILYKNEHFCIVLDKIIAVNEETQSDHIKCWIVVMGFKEAYPSTEPYVRVISRLNEALEKASKK